MTQAGAIEFIKMQGAGNDFVFLTPGHGDAVPLSPALAAKLADRRFGIGCDQVIAAFEVPDADLGLRIFNADGSEVAACGNATRCAAHWLMHRRGVEEVTIRTPAGILRGRRQGAAAIVDMGRPAQGWDRIPLAREADASLLPLDAALPPAFCVSMGNPHAVLFVEDAAAADLAHWGPLLEHHPIFPERANISFATITGPEDITLRVWERGAGATLACGTAACATLVAAASRGLIPGRKVRLHLPGGVLPVEWDAQGHVWLGGPVAVAFTGSFRVEDYTA